MNIQEFVLHLLPNGSDAWRATHENPHAGPENLANACPTWPPDLFAVVGSIIEASGCYTLASPHRDSLAVHAAYLDAVAEIAGKWNADPAVPPDEVSSQWADLLGQYGLVEIKEICHTSHVADMLMMLFVVADEACIGLGWDVNKEQAQARQFAALVMASMGYADVGKTLMPHLPNSFCIMVPPDRATVLPKSLTPSVGCTIRSLSHHLSLLPSSTVIESTWLWSTTQRATADRPDPMQPYDVRIMLVPFPYTVSADCFQLSSPRTTFGDGKYNLPAYFRLKQLWLDLEDDRPAGQIIAHELIIPLVEQSYKHSGVVPDGIVLPECALTTEIAEQMVQALHDYELNIEFIIAGILGGTHYNRAQTFVLRGAGAVKREQNKHHRWRLDKSQVERYALDFDDDHDNSQWWEDIDVSNRQLPFFGLRKDMCITTLICEDLARADPAMGVIRAVGPNLVIALLMDGPQLATRWPGRYATVLADDPGSAVLSFTSSAMVDRSNWLESRPARAIGLWRDAGGRTQEIALPHGSLGIL